MTSIGREPFDCHHIPVPDSTNGRYAGTDNLAIEVYCASAAERLAAAIFGASETEHVAKHPKKWHLRIDVELMSLAINANCETHGLASSLGHSAPVCTQAAMISPNCSCVPGAGSRSAPGAQPHATKLLSCALCSTICASDLPPFRFGSFICSQM